MISSSELHLKLPVYLYRTRRRPSLHAKFRPQSDFYFLVNSPSMPYLKAPKQSPSTPAASKFAFTCSIKRLFLKPHILINVNYGNKYPPRQRIYEPARHPLQLTAYMSRILHWQTARNMKIKLPRHLRTDPFSVAG